MIECILTLDYEIYGNGRGSLHDLIFKPAHRLIKMMMDHKVRLVNFVEAVELERIQSKRSDPAIEAVIGQIREFYDYGFEIGLHMHPQWHDAHLNNSVWQLDSRSYNLCTMPQERIESLIDRSITFLRKILADPAFIPFSFRNGNWLFQPAQPLATVLAQRGIHLDSTVFKGGMQKKHNMDYRHAPDNRYFWRFSEDVLQPDPKGMLLEIPTYTKMAFLWQLIDNKRINLQKKASVYDSKDTKLKRLRDYMRLKYPLKLDFCRLPFEKLKFIFETVLLEDQINSTSFKPIVAIGHTKDLADLKTVEQFLCYLREKNIPISTFRDVYGHCQ